MKKYFDIAFTDSVNEAQKQYGSRDVYEKHAARIPQPTALSQREVGLIQEMDGFYMSTVNADGWPYVQFRGGPKGFLKIIDKQSLGFADFKGNLQYISTGNINQTKKAALILMHYPSRTRLKVWAEVEILDPSENEELKEQLIVSDYNAQVERLFIFHIVSFGLRAEARGAL